MVEGSMTVVKYLMFFFNFLFWLSGLALIVIGAVIRDKYGDYFSYADNSFANVAVFIIIVGVIVFIIGFLGCCGAIKENYCMVTTFAVILGIIFILEIVAGAVGFAYRKKVEEKATDALKRAVKNYDETNVEPGAQKLMDWVQQEFSCCGYEDKRPTTSTNTNGTCKANVVKSCYKDEDCNKEEFKKNCKQSFIDFVEKNLAIIGAVSLAIAFVEILGIIFACCLMKAIKGEYEVV